jgi:glyoxylase-like metal-dependent hydrolase (beta-lactamase superfamily II)
MSVSRRHFLRHGAGFALAAPLFGSTLPVLAAPPPAGIDYSLVRKPFFGRRVAARDITATEIGGLTLWRGAGCNVVALPGTDGALVVDGGLEINADLLLPALHGRLGTHRIRTLFNTHWHPEQTGLNAAAGRDGGNIISHEVSRLATGRTLRSPLFDGTIGPLPRAARPTDTTYDQGRIEFAGEEVSYLHLPGAHTGGDLCVHFPRRNVLVAGGPVTSDRWPVIDYANGGFMHGFVRSYELLAQLVRADTVVVPASGPVMTGAELVAMKDLYRELFQQFFVLFNKGLGPTDVAQFNAGKQFQGVVPIVADRPLQDSPLLLQLGDPGQFLEYAFRSTQLATLPF